MTSRTLVSERTPSSATPGAASDSSTSGPIPSSGTLGRPGLEMRERIARHEQVPADAEDAVRVRARAERADGLLDGRRPGPIVGLLRSAGGAPGVSGAGDLDGRGRPRGDVGVDDGVGDPLRVERLARDLLE